MKPEDFGPIYAETTEGLLRNTLPVEPWNTFSNLIFLLIAIHIAYLTRLDRSRYPLLVYSLPLLLLGWIGGTLYHGTRSHSLWLAMDFAPIGILATTAALVFWKRVTGRWSTAILFLLLVAVGGRVLPQFLPIERGIKISFGYVALALALLIPLGLHLLQTARHELISFGIITVVFIATVFFRSIDNSQILPMGTHFLWHLAGGASVWMLMLLIKRITDCSRPDSK